MTDGLPGARPMPSRAAAGTGAGEHGVRPYLLTKGRTRPAQLAGGFETLVVITELGRERLGRIGPEHSGLLHRADSPISVAELSARLVLPLGVVQVLAGDLVGGGLLAQHAAAAGTATDPDLLRRVITAFEKI